MHCEASNWLIEASNWLILPPGNRIITVAASNDRFAEMQRQRSQRGRTRCTREVMAVFVLAGRWRETVAPRRALQKSWLQSETSVSASSAHHGHGESHPKPGGWWFCGIDAWRLLKSVLQTVPLRAADHSDQGAAQLQLCFLCSGKRI